MRSFKILSDRLTIGKQGQTIDEDALDGANIQALLDGGHLEAVGVKTKSQSQLEGE
jgi:hypothetical protein